MAEADDAIANLAVGLNEDAKAARKPRGKSGTAALAAARDNLSGDAPIVADHDPAALGEALDGLGSAIAANEGVAPLDLSEGAHVKAIDRMEGMASDYEIETRSLIPDVRDFLLDQIKCRPKPWSATSNGEQRDVAAACEHAAVELTRKMIEAIRSAGAIDPIRCLLVGFADKGDDIKVDLKVKAVDAEATLAAVMALHQARGKHVLVTVASVDDFRGDGREAETDEDQPPLDFEAGGPPELSDDDLSASDLAQPGDATDFSADGGEEE